MHYQNTLLQLLLALIIIGIFYRLERMYEEYLIIQRCPPNTPIDECTETRTQVNRDIKGTMIVLYLVLALFFMILTFSVPKGAFDDFRRACFFAALGLFYIATVYISTTGKVVGTALIYILWAILFYIIYYFRGFIFFGPAENIKEIPTMALSRENKYIYRTL